MANVEGDVEEIGGIMRITKIRIRYTFQVPGGLREKAERALEVYAEKCPAYLSVKDCIDVSWTAAIESS